MKRAGPLGKALAAALGRAVQEAWPDPPFEVIRLDRSKLVAAAARLRDAEGFAMLSDLTAVDYLGHPSPGVRGRFEVVYTFSAPPAAHRVRLKVALKDTDPVVPSLSGLYSSANWLEREVWDMFGIRFEGHPDPRRILMYKEFSGHPLRKDYPLTRQQPRVEQSFPGVPPFGKDPRGMK